MILLKKDHVRSRLEIPQNFPSGFGLTSSNRKKMVVNLTFYGEQVHSEDGNNKELEELASTVKLYFKDKFINI